MQIRMQPEFKECRREWRILLPRHSNMECVGQEVKDCDNFFLDVRNQEVEAFKFRAVQVLGLTNSIHRPCLPLANIIKSKDVKTNRKRETILNKQSLRGWVIQFGYKRNEEMRRKGEEDHVREKRIM
jgi:hypothetical protein